MTDEDLVLDRLTWCDDDIVTIQHYRDEDGQTTWPAKKTTRGEARERWKGWTSVGISMSRNTSGFEIIRPFMTADGRMIYPEDNS